MELSARLRKAGANVWLDQVDIEPGKIWDFEIEKALQGAEAVIFIATEKSTSSNNVLNEVYYALEDNKEVIPAIFHDCKMPFRLKRLQYIDFTADYEAGLERLLKSLHLKADAAALAAKDNIDAHGSRTDEKRIPVEQPHPVRKQPPPVHKDPAPAPTAQMPYPSQQYAPQTRKSNHTVFWVIGGVVVLLLILAGMYSGGSSSSEKKTAYDPPVQNNADTSTLVEAPAVKKSDAKAAADKPRSNNSWRTFSQLNYGIQYPPNWDLNENAGLGTSFVIFSRLEGASDLFRENVSLVIQNLAGRNIDLDKFVTISEEQVRTMAVNGVLLESRRLNDGQYPHHLMVYSSDQNGYHLTTEQYYWVLGVKAYVLTLSCEQDKFSSYRDVGEQILNSFYFN